MTCLGRSPDGPDEEVLELLEMDIESLHTLAETLALWPGEHLSHRTHPEPRYTEKEVWDALCRLVGAGKVVLLLWQDGRYVDAPAELLQSGPRHGLWLQLAKKG